MASDVNNHFTSLTCLYLLSDPLKVLVLTQLKQGSCELLHSTANSQFFSK